MSKQSQYYSENNDSPNVEFYPDRCDHGSDAVDVFRPDLDEVNAEQPHFYSDSSSQNFSQDRPAAQWVNPISHEQDHYPAPYTDASSNEMSDSSDPQFGDYYSDDYERGFDQPIDPNLPEYYNSSPESHFNNRMRLEPNISVHSNERYFTDSHAGQEKASGIRVTADDLLDCPQQLKGFQIPKALIAVGTVCLLVTVGAAVYHFSKPSVSAYEIVQMESYEGIQKAPAVLNLTDLKGSNADIAKQTTAIREIPAVNPVDVDTTRQISADTVKVIATNNAKQADLRVQSLWSNLRAAPDRSGAIITTLQKGTLLHVIGSQGKWYEIQAENDPQQRGFMHRSTVEPVTE